MAEVNPEEILTDEDIKFLAANKEFGKLLEYLNTGLSELRLRVDTVSCERLGHLQGGIQAYRDIIKLFEDIINEDRRD